MKILDKAGSLLITKAALPSQPRPLFKAWLPLVPSFFSLPSLWVSCWVLVALLVYWPVLSSVVSKWLSRCPTQVVLGTMPRSILKLADTSTRPVKYTEKALKFTKLLFVAIPSVTHSRTPVAPQSIF